MNAILVYLTITKTIFKLIFRTIYCITSQLHIPCNKINTIIQSMILYLQQQNQVNSNKSNKTSLFFKPIVKQINNYSTYLINSQKNLLKIVYIMILKKILSSKQILNDQTNTFILFIIEHLIFMAFFKKEDIVSWGVLAVIILILYFVFSDGQFSLIFTLAGTVQTFGFALIAIKIRKSRSVAGLSRETFICYTVIFAVRFFLFMFFRGYLPNDTTGNLIFKIQEGAALILSGYILYCLVSAFKVSYNQDLDTVKSYYIIGVAAVLALIFHSSLNRSFIGDYLWAFSQYLETFAILSQFVLFRNKKGDIESYTSHFVAAQGISRILFIIFWIFTYAQLNTEKAMSLLSEYVGYWFMASQIIHLIIMGDFMYYWIKAVRHGTGVIQLPTYI